MTVSPSAQPLAWLVDLDGTLYAPRPVKRRMALELLIRGPRWLWPLRCFRHAHERLRQEPALQQPAETPFEAQLRLAAAELSWPVERLQKLVQEWMIERPCRHLARAANQSLIQELRAARATGLRLALVSDYPARRKLAALGLGDLFEVVVANGEPAGPARLKPDPAGYRLAAELLGLPPERCLVLGDRPDADGLAAERAGMSYRRIRAG